ncbi:MAG: divalent-cation tolerance protein CutA [Acidobacteriota bacterium]|nr:MAG: divalent-cation tolerance protein CutA [Acidobacteriota bacterium]
MAEHIMAVTTTGDEESAVALARELVERRIVACVNILPRVRSLYRWKETIEDDTECVLLMKTRAERFQALASALDELHAYDVPELIVLPIEQGSAAYLRWIGAST